jgi:putative two-component system response regulator
MGNKKNQTILVVDDDKGTRTLLSNVLKKYNVITAENGKRALEFAGDENNMPDIILLDVIMPGMDGYEVCKQLKTNPKTKKIPVIFLTIADKPNLEVYGLGIGAVDYIKKPIYNEILMARVGTHLELKEHQENLEFLVDERTREVRALNEEIIDTQKEIIFTLSEVMENRSEETARHVQRVSNCMYLLALKKGLNFEEAELLKAASPMHDIGKIGIPDEILNKRGRLTEDECDTIKSHTTIGYNILKRSNRNIMKTAAIIAHQHHEQWDGNGYPQGLKGEEIHIYGRIAAIADALDAMTNKRVYQKAKTKVQIIEELKKEKGKQFDPELTELVLENIDKFYKILEAHPDKK